MTEKNNLKVSKNNVMKKLRKVITALIVLIIVVAFLWQMSLGICPVP